jgi:hypothetical protein
MQIRERGNPEEVNNLEVSEIPKPKRKVGRPRKEKVEKPKGKVGRPRKNKNTVVLDI